MHRLLHHKACVSTLSDMTEGTFFQRLIVEGGRGDNMKKRSIASVDDHKIKRLIICSGKVFYHLYHVREAAAIDDIAVVRLEQIAPFPYDLMGPVLKRYSNAEIVWCQEEPKNMGAWSFVKPRLLTTLRENGLPNRQIIYVGRIPNSTPASGGYKVHVKEQRELVEEALRLKVKQ